MRESGISDGDDRHQHRPHAVDQVGEPERQVALQQRRAVAVEALGFLGERPLGVAARSGSRPCCWNQPALAVHAAAPPARTAGSAPGACRACATSAAVGATSVHVRAAACRCARSTTPRGSVDRAQEREAPRVAPRPGRSRTGGCPASAAASAPSATRAPRRTRSRRCSPSSRPTTAGVCGSRQRVERRRGRCWLASSSRAHQVGHAAAARADVDAPAGELRRGSSARAP